MERKLALALALAKGAQLHEDAHTIEVGGDDASVYNEAGRYVASIDIGNEHLGLDMWSLDLTGDYEFTVEEFNQWLEDNPTAVADYQRERQAAMLRMSEIVPEVQEKLAEALNLSKKYGLPFTVDVEGEEVDLRRAHLVDWNSSSMYC